MRRAERANPAKDAGAPSRSHASAAPAERQSNRQTAELLQPEAKSAAPASRNGPSAAASWLAADNAGELAPGQMRKSEFLDALRLAVCETADEGMAGTGRTSAGCPWISHWFSEYAKKGPAEIERAARLYAPETVGMRSASDAIPALAARVRRSVDRWALTGEITGLPEGVPTDLPGSPLFFRRADGARPVDADPAAVAASLGPGRPMAPSLRSRMETAFGRSFARVRMHTDSAASGMAQSLDARAFAVGEHVAFGPGEFQPDSIEGQALLAHELAHVSQQGGGVARSGPEPSSASAEQDADASAVRAVTSILRGERGLANLAGSAMPAIRSGLRLQRCGTSDPAPRKEPDIEATEDALASSVTSCMLATNNGHSSDKGIWYVFQYRKAFPGKWEDDWKKGYANPDYWERIGHMKWRLKKGKSASAGLKAWLRGLTIAECRSTTIAANFKAIMEFIGEKKFDERFGSATEDTLPIARLTFGSKGSEQLDEFMKPVDVASRGGPGTIGRRPAKVGEWHYFRNHPKYLLKHPGGVFQGENAVLVEDPPPPAEQVWTGLGEDKKTERAMINDMVTDYNQKRRADDLTRLDEIKAKYGGSLPSQYDPANFPDIITFEDVYDAPPYEYTNPFTGAKRTFKGGYSPGAGQQLDFEKLQRERNGP